MCILCKIYVSIYRATSQCPIRNAHFAQIQYLQGLGVLHYTKVCIFPVTFFMKAGEQLERDLYFLMYQTIWKFHKKYINNISGDNAFWDEVINEADMITKKYHNHNFIIALVSAELTEFERLHRELIKDADARI